MKKWKYSVKYKLYSMFIVSFILPVILITVIFSVYYYGVMMNQEKQNMDRILASINDNMELQYMELMNICNTYYMQNDVFREIESLNNPQLYGYYDDLMMSQLENEYSLMITKLLYTANQKIRDVVFFPINTQRETCYYLDKNSSRLQSLSYPEYEKEDWFQEALKADGKALMYPGNTPPYAEEGTREVYSCVRAIKNMDSKKYIGVIKIDGEMENLIKTIDILQEDSKDGIVISQDGEIIVKTPALSSELELGKAQGTFWMNGNIYYQRTRTVPDTQWDITYAFYVGSLLQSCLYAVLAALIVILLAVLLAFGIYRKSSKIVIHDISHITQVLAQVQKGNLEVQANVSSTNEFQDITEAINQMINNLKKYIEQKYILVIKQQKAEYMALQSQINPHFLYNTLNGFIALNRMGEKKRLEKAIISLTHLFRYTCTKNDMTAIEEEIDFLKRYLELEKLKYEERLDYIVWMDEKCAGRKIPKLLLQPIVENSIVHGMGDLAEPIMITIVVRAVEINGMGHFMVVSIRDNGVGYDEEKISRQKERVGMDNVKTRMELYDSHSIYQCISKPGIGTKTTLVFPELNERDER